MHHNGLGSGKTGIFATFSNGMVVEIYGSYVTGKHVVYINNSSDDFTIRSNHLYDNAATGIHLNGDASFVGDGTMPNDRISENRNHDNGLLGGAAINMGGVEDMLVANNLIYLNHAGGPHLAALPRRKSPGLNAQSVLSPFPLSAFHSIKKDIGFATSLQQRPYQWKIENGKTT